MKPLLSLFALGLLGLSASAQTPEPAPSRSFRVISIGQVYDNLAYSLNSKTVPVFATSGAVSRPLPAPKEKVLKLFRETPPPAGSPAGTPPTRIVVAEIPYAANLTEALVLLAPAAETAALPIMGVAIADLPKMHTLGTARLINLSSMHAGFGLNKTIIEVAPLDTQKIVSFVPGVTQVNLAVQVKVSASWEPVVSMERNLSENLRIYMVLMDSPPQREFGPAARAVMVLDYVRPPKPEKRGPELPTKA